MSRLLYRLSYAAIGWVLYCKNRPDATVCAGFSFWLQKCLQAPPPPERPPPNEPEWEREELPDDELGEESRGVSCSRVLL